MAQQIIKTRFKIRHGTSADWEKANPILLEGEPAYATDTNTYKIGDGIRHWLELPQIGGDSIELDIQIINGGNAYGDT